MFLKKRHKEWLKRLLLLVVTPLLLFFLVFQILPEEIAHLIGALVCLGLVSVGSFICFINPKFVSLSRNDGNDDFVYHGLKIRTWYKVTRIFMTIVFVYGLSILFPFF